MKYLLYFPIFCLVVQSAEYNCVSKSLFSKIDTNRDTLYFENNDNKYCFEQSAQSNTLELQKPLPVQMTPSYSDALLFDTVRLGESSDKNISADNTSAKVNDPIYYISEGRYKPILLPSRLSYGSTCVKDSVLYLRNSSVSCTFDGLTAELCPLNTNVNFLTYKIDTILQKYRDPTSQVNVSFRCFNFDANGDTKEEITCSGPAYQQSPDRCTNVVKSIKYTLEHGGPEGVLTISAELGLGSVDISKPIVLKAEVIFNSARLVYPNTGNRNITKNSKMKVTIGPNKSIWYPFNDAKMAPIIFPYSSIVGISETVGKDPTVQKCSDISSILNRTIPDSVAKFADAAEAGDWVNVSSVGVTAFNCTSVLTYLDVRVYYKSFGLLLNPTNEITSVTVRKGTSNFNALNQQGLLGEKFVLYYSVRFVNLDAVIVDKDGNALEQIFRAFPRYGTPTLLFLICILIFILLPILLLIGEQRKHPQ